MLAILSVFAMIALDQLVKYWTITVVKPAISIPVIPNVFHFTYVENRGAAFSILQGRKLFFVIITAVVLLMILYVFRKGLIVHATGKWALLMVAGGAIGNLIDRILRGFVVDVFDFCLIHFPVFNVADIFVVCGGFLFAFYILFQHPSSEKTDDN